MSEGGQRGTGNDYVLFLFFPIYFIIPQDEVRGVGGGQNRDFLGCWKN